MRFFISMTAAVIIGVAALYLNKHIRDRIRPHEVRGIAESGDAGEVGTVGEVLAPRAGRARV